MANSFPSPRLLLPQSLLCPFSRPASGFSALGTTSLAFSGRHVCSPAGRWQDVVLPAVSARYPGHGQWLSGSAAQRPGWDRLTPGPSCPPEPPGVHAFPAGDAAGQLRGRLVPQPRLPSAKCHQAGTRQPGLPGHHPVRTPLCTRTLLSAGPGWGRCQPGSSLILPLVQARPRGTLGRVSISFLLSGLEWALLAMGRDQRYC